MDRVHLVHDARVGLPQRCTEPAAVSGLKSLSLYGRTQARSGGKSCRAVKLRALVCLVVTIKRFIRAERLIHGDAAPRFGCCAGFIMRSGEGGLPHTDDQMVVIFTSEVNRLHGPVVYRVRA